MGRVDVSDGMTLDVDRPDPPELEETDPNDYDDAEVVGDTDYKREELESLLREGAWEQAFEEWTEDTDLDEREFAIVAELDMIQHFDFFWDAFADRVGYHAPRTGRSVPFTPDCPPGRRSRGSTPRWPNSARRSAGR
jgi:hypothetical protein